MVPVMNLQGLSEAQLKDICRHFKRRRIPYVKTPDHLGRRFLYVGEKNYLRACQTIKQEFVSFALVERAKWEREWQTIYRGSYWRWLTKRKIGNAMMAGL